jgi:PhnB protein
MSTVDPIPAGFHTVTPYLIVRGAERLIEFLKQAFGAEEIYRSTQPDGRIGHTELRIGDSMVELAEGNDQWQPMPCALHLYVPDTDATYRRALEAGATSLFEPADTFYGDRSGGVADPSGNQWYIATRMENLSHEEMTRRAQAAGKLV